MRIGNGAADQLQMDIYGEALDSIYFADQHGIDVDLQTWSALRGIVDWLTDNWDQPGEGIWETRGGQKDFTYGRVMSWVAFDRAIRLAAERGLPGSVGRWVTTRDAIYNQVMQRGWNDEARGVRAALRRHRAGLVDAAHGNGRLHRAHRPDVAVDAGRDGGRAGGRQPGLPLRPGRLTGRAGR